MTTTEHLHLIKAECERLLALAEKADIKSVDLMGNRYISINDSPWADFNTEPHMTTYIAACAGRAEAGWRATIAAIDYIGGDAETFSEKTPRGQAARSQIGVILAAWPIELLTTKPQ